MKIDTDFKVKCNANKIYMYLLLIPFLCPRGFFEYSTIYKLVFTLWIYAAAVAVCFIFIYMVANDYRRFKSCIYWVLGYYLFFVLDTLFIQHGIDEGIQKLFIAPILCLLCGIFLEKEQRDFIDCIANILIVDFVLNLTLFSPLFWGGYFSADYNLLFIGHVQIASQLGIVGLFVGYLIYNLEPAKKNKAIALLGLSVLTMIVSKTSAAAIVLVFIFVCLLFLCFVNYKKIFTLDSRLYAAVILIFDGLFLYYLKSNNWNFSIFGKHMTLNGRTTIWKEVFEMLKFHELFGYGAYGARIQVYWSRWSDNPEGMTYAHGQIQQLLLDGGIILLCLFCLLLLSYLKEVKKIKGNSKQIQCFANICLISILVIMITESVTEYYYIFIFLSLLAYLPEIVSSAVQTDPK